MGMDWITLLIGGPLILVGPGLAWSIALLPSGRAEWLERFAVTVGLSLGIVPLAVLWGAYFFGMPINFVSLVLIAVILTAIPMVFLSVVRGPGLSKRLARLRLVASRLRRW